MAAHNPRQTLATLKNLAALLADEPGITNRMAAGMYASAGIFVFPLWPTVETWNGKAGEAFTRMCACGQRLECGSPGKHPLVPNGVSKATRNMETVTAWWARWPKANIGLAADLNGLAIIDVDTIHDGEASFDTLARWCEQRSCDLYDTLTVRTPSGGSHYYYHAPHEGIKTATKTFGEKGYGLDTRGVGGYVVAPPSTGIGGQYLFLPGPTRIAQWPAELTQAIANAYPERRSLSPLAQNAPPTPPRGKGWGAAALAGECEAVATAKRPHGTQGGERNARLNAAAYKVGRIVAGGHLDALPALKALEAAAKAAGLPEREAAATIASGWAAGQKNPRHPAPARPLPATQV